MGAGSERRRRGYRKGGVWSSESRWGRALQSISVKRVGSLWKPREDPDLAGLTAEQSRRGSQRVCKKESIVG